mmetsp:Transcript_5834/g.17260  ORF Transcript_5834/g.17260 Transcript_5834/m.17260 type:complete len:303 (+) Transcript_5834:1028-1936(+)
MEQSAAVGHDRVDTGENLEKLDDATQRNHIAKVRIHEYFGPRRSADALLLIEFRSHHGKLLRGEIFVAATQNCQDPERLLLPPGLLQETQRLADEQEAECCAQAEHALNTQGPSPTPRPIAVEEVQQRYKDDGQAHVTLVQADHGAADPRRGHLGNVGGARRRRGADAKPGHPSAQNEHCSRPCARLHKPTCSKQYGAEDESRPATEPVDDQMPEEQGSNSSPDVKRAHHKALAEGDGRIVRRRPIHHLTERWHREDHAEDTIAVAMEKAGVCHEHAQAHHAPIHMAAHWLMLAGPGGGSRC